MAWKKIVPNNANKVVQFEVKDIAESISVKMAGVDLDTCNIKVEMISKNKSGKVLYDLTYSQLQELLVAFYPQFNGIIPLSMSGNLTINSDNYILVTVSWTTGTATDFEYSLNTGLNSASYPLVLKPKTVDGEIELDTEFYNLIALPVELTNFETVVMVQNTDGKMYSQKISYTKEYLNSLKKENTNFSYIPVELNQVVNLTSDDSVTVYLIQSI